MIYTAKTLIKELENLDKHFPDYKLYIVNDTGNKPSQRNNGFEPVGFKIDREKEELYIVI